MALAKVSEDEFIRLWNANGGHAHNLARIIGVNEKNVYDRRRRIEKSRGIALTTASQTRVGFGNAVVTHQISDGTMLIGSDAHIWPGPLTTMQRAFLKFVERHKPNSVVANGDFFDGARVNRHPSIGWETAPMAHEQISAVQDYLGEIERLRPQAKRFWPMGNHDLNFESHIANRAPEFAKIHGVHLKDHFPNWIPCWRLDVNEDIVIRHRELGGEHADFNNVVKGGKTIITGHDHRTGVVPYRNYRGLLYGVRCGFMADSALDPMFVHYLEGRAPNWSPAFVVLTFKDGVLLMPELVTKFDDGRVQFRGEVIEV